MGIPLANGIAGADVNYADGPYHNLFKREKDSLKGESTSQELDDSNLEEIVTKSTKKREAKVTGEGEHSEEKVNRYKVLGKCEVCVTREGRNPTLYGNKA